MINIRLLTLEDLDKYSELRMYGLAESPKAFASSPEDCITRDKQLMLQKFKKLGEEEIIVGAFDDETMIGLTGMHSDIRKAKTRHRGYVWGVYVLPAFRGQGISSKMLQMTIEESKHMKHLQQLHLGVGTYNSIAHKAYVKAGFIEYGREPNSLMVDGEPLEEILMVLFL